MRNMKFSLNFKGQALFVGTVLFLLIGFWYVALTARPINFVASDLGRHIVNGALVFQQPLLLYSNFYSYTATGSPFINHHWGSGWIFFSIYSAFGFVGLSCLYLMLQLSALALIFREAVRKGWIPALAASLFAIPLLSDRSDVRPEAFSVLFLTIYYCVLSAWLRGSKNRNLYLLPLLMLVWANLHIYFAFGFVLLGLCIGYLLWIVVGRGERAQEDRLYLLLKIFALSVLTAMVNPFTYQLLLYPFQIFSNYGYRVLENQTPFFLWKLGVHKESILSYFVLMGATLFLWPAHALLQRKRLSFYPFACFALFGVLASLAVRNFSLFALFSIPLLTEIFSQLQDGWKKKWVAVVFLSTAIGWNALYVWTQSVPVMIHLGVPDTLLSSARFFREHKLEGPIFNNYDIGSYLIFELFSKERVFVDNRPEAYPENFFSNVLIPMQSDEAVWKEKSTQYGINAIYFYRQDRTDWAMPFLRARIEDPVWAPVYADPYVIILLKNNEKNKELIEKFRIPKEKL